MSKALNSPTARILRSSRFFSMPPPLPQPSIDLPTTSGNIRTSDTATLPYPTKQAITAPASSRHRGDWGLKRPLPEKTNKTSTPHVRINAMDTLEHITDFDAASDHTLTLRKAQEMNLWMTQSNKKKSSDFSPVATSAFDDGLDHTALQERTIATPRSGEGINQLSLGAERALRIRSINRILQQRGEKIQRWKTDGPWIPSMSEIDFDKYLVDVVSKPRIRTEFRQFLLKVRSDKKRMQAAERLREESGFNPDNPEDLARLDEVSRVDDGAQEIDKYLLELRNDNSNLASELPGLIQEFFDLPPIPKPSSRGQVMAGALTDSLRSSEAPPATHPSAGLSYLRTRAFMDNSPVYGPQHYHAPMQARVLRPRRAPQGPSEQATLGVGGFVAKDKTKGQGYKSTDPESNDYKGNEWNFETPGGNKLWVTPKQAIIGDDGRVRLEVDYPDKETVAVKTGGEDPRNIRIDDNDAIRQQLKNIAVASDADQRNTAPPGTAGNANYGSALPDTRRAPRAKPFEGEELKSFEDAIKQARMSLGMEEDE